MGEKQEGDKKKNEGEKKSDGAAAGGSATVVMKFDMHCEGCAKKVRKSLKNFNGVENVKADCSTGKLTVVGKVDPEKLKAKVEEKTKKKVEIVSLQPNKASNKDGGGGGGEEKKSDDKKSEVKSEDKKSEDKNQEKKPKEPQVATVLLKTRVHCEGCAQKIKKIIRKCDGVNEVNVDMEKDMITMKGTMDMKDLLPYLSVKLKRNVEIAPAKKDDGGGDKKPKDVAGSKDKPKEGDGGGGGGGPSEKPAEKKEGGGDSSEKAPKKKGGDGGGEKKDAGGGSGGGGGGEGGPPRENVTKIEVNKMEYNPYGYGGYGSHAYTYDPRQQMEGYNHQVVDYWHEQEYSHPPQMFSDENPNACSVM